MSEEKYVSVGCKLPNGLHLDMKGNDGAMIRVTLKGSNASRIVGGFGITENVSADFMTAWLKKNSKHPAVVNGSIFLHADAKSAEAMAKDRAGQTTGLEAIDPLASKMLRNEKGEEDKAAVAAYKEAMAKNPERNRQRAE